MTANNIDGQMKQLRKQGAVTDLPTIPTLVDMLFRKYIAVIDAFKIPENKKRHPRIKDGMIVCKCRKCGVRMVKSEMIQPVPENHKYLLTPECAERYFAKKRRAALRKES